MKIARRIPPRRRQLAAAFVACAGALIQPLPRHASARRRMRAADNLREMGLKMHFICG